MYKLHYSDLKLGRFIKGKNVLAIILCYDLKY